MKHFEKILIANRGEIAVRIIRTARDMGIATAVVHSEVDTGAPFTLAADEAVNIGGSTPGESYLLMDKVLEAAKRVGADAIHPGYGFLSENAAFAEAVEAAGMVFIGPPVGAIHAMGLKRESKLLVMERGVPVIQGYNGEDQSDERLMKEALEIGFPLLIKASAGGGGKGMRISRGKDDLQASIDTARREAKNAFGNDVLILERYLENPRHVEIQVMGDQYGDVIHLMERECSIQRRHQKILEESPSTALSPELRQKMGDAAVAAAKAVNYVGAGTVEFILDQSGEFFFLEMNTRLQVEHPVTEKVTRKDLVRMQIEVAQGIPLGLKQEDVKPWGAAVEARLYAEDPMKEFLPATGTISRWKPPTGRGIRVDTGVETGSVISVFYDPMIAKVIAFGSSRQEANQRLTRALEELVCEGLTTNQDFLLQVLRHPDYRKGNISTSFIDQHFPPDARVAAKHPDKDLWHGAAAAIYLFEAERQQRRLLPAVAPNFRNNPWRWQEVQLREGEADVRVDLDPRGKGFFGVRLGEQESVARVVKFDGESLRLSLEDLERSLTVSRNGDALFVRSLLGTTQYKVLPRFPEPEEVEDKGSCKSPMPGKILSIMVEAGQEVEKGQPLVVMEAMKMEHTLTAPAKGKVTAVLVKEAEIVEAGVDLVSLEAEEEAEA